MAKLAQMASTRPHRVTREARERSDTFITDSFIEPDATVAADLPGDPELTLGRYRLGRRLGAGGFATVYAAHDERLDREVAIKVLPRERVIHSRFEREARAAARLHHPGIVTLFEAAVDDEGAYLVSELVAGRTLDGALAAGELSDRDILEVAIAIADALEHAHLNDVVHRDVKPQNVLIPKRGRGSSRGGLAAAKLTDFGVAHVVGGDTLTRAGDVIGTLAYMAPEQAEGRASGPPADLYSLALLTYEALSGVNPVAELLRQGRRRLGVHLPPLRRQRADLPRPLGAAIDRALRPRASERGSLSELRAALEGCLPVVGDIAGVVTDAPTLALTRREETAVTRRGTRAGTRVAGRPAPAAVPTARRRTTLLALTPQGPLLLGAGLVAVGLGAVGLAGIWPALVAQTIAGWWRRALIAAGGIAWLGLAALIGPGHPFYFPLAHVTVASLRPLAIAAGIWALAAAIGPLLTPGRYARLELLGAVALAAGTAIGVAHAGLGTIDGLVPGAVIGGLLAAHRPLLQALREAIGSRALP